MKTRVYLEYFEHDCRYPVLFEDEKYDLIYNRIRNLIGVKSGITCAIISHNYANIKVDSYNDAFDDTYVPRKNIDFACYNIH